MTQNSESLLSAYHHAFVGESLDVRVALQYCIPLSLLNFLFLINLCVYYVIFFRYNDVGIVCDFGYYLLRSWTSDIMPMQTKVTSYSSG